VSCYTCSTQPERVMSKTDSLSQRNSNSFELSPKMIAAKAFSLQIDILIDLVIFDDVCFLTVVC